MAKLHLKPTKGFIVRDPQTLLPLKPEGEEKPDTTYWRRRLRDGDVEIVKSSAATQKIDAKANGGKPK